LFFNGLRFVAWNLLHCEFVLASTAAGSCDSRSRPRNGRLSTRRHFRERLLDIQEQALGTPSREAVVATTILRRRSDEGGPLFRGSRYFAVGHEWYAHTRESKELGPFSSRSEAELLLAWHLALQVEDQADAVNPLEQAAGEALTPLEIQRDELVVCRRDATARGIAAACIMAQQRLDAIEGISEPGTRSALRAEAIRYFLNEADW
jgi:hypothetical protein